MSVDTSGNASHDDTRSSFGPGVRRSSSVDSARVTTDSSVPHSLRFTALNQSSATVRTDSVDTVCNTSTQGIEISSNVNVNASDSDTSSQSSVFSSEHRVWPFDPETSTIDLRYLRSTDLPFNSFVHMPPPLREEEEIKFQNLKHELVGVTHKYVQENKVKAQREGKEDRKFTNLTVSEERGLESVLKRDDIVVFQTDKSGRMAVDSKENYIRAAEPHVSSDEVVDSKTHVRCQKEINAHSSMWVRFMKAGEFTSTSSIKGQDRIRNSMKVYNHGYAPLYALRKDHKEVDDPVLGPPTRPVCGGSSAYNNKLSYFLGLLLRPVWQEKDTVCLSTEEMLAAIHETNESGVLDEECTIGSADVAALYPSIDVEIASAIVSEMFIESDVQVADVDTRELGLYLSLNRTRAQLTACGLAEYCPKRKSNRGRPPTMTGCAQNKKTQKRHRPWKRPENDRPSDAVIKRMLGESLGVAIEVHRAQP